MRLPGLYTPPPNSQEIQQESCPGKNTAEGICFICSSLRKASKLFIKGCLKYGVYFQKLARSRVFYAVFYDHLPI